MRSGKISPILADVLRQVNLKSHSYRVARSSLILLKTYRDFEHLVPKATVAALATTRRSRRSGCSAYAKGDHPNVSAARVAEIFRRRLVLAHATLMRSKPPPVDAGSVRSASQAGRRYGPGNRSGRGDARTAKKEWTEWFQPAELLGKVTPHVNIVQTANKWKAFFSSVVYCQPDFLFELTKELAYEKRVMDIMLTGPPTKRRL